MMMFGCQALVMGITRGKYAGLWCVGLLVLHDDQLQVLLMLLPPSDCPNIVPQSIFGAIRHGQTEE